MLSFSDPHRTLVGLHDMLTGWQSIRDRRRTRHVYDAAPNEPPAASMHTAPVSEVPPDPRTVVGYRKLGDRMVPIYGDPAEAPEPAAEPSRAQEPSSECEVPPQAASPRGGPPPETTMHSQQPPPPPDFTPATVAASAPPRPTSAPLTLDLPPPTPPSLVRTDEQAAMLERVLAEHRAELARQSAAQQAQHAAVMQAILAEHRLAQAEADSQHRQHLADLLAHRLGEPQGASAIMDEHNQAVVQLRELLAEQASAQHAEHARVGSKIEAITDLVSIVGETVHRIAAAAFLPQPPPPPPPPEQAARPAAPSPEQAAKLRPDAERTLPQPPMTAPTTAPGDLRSVEPVQEATAPQGTQAPPRGPDFGPAAPCILALADSHGSMATPSAVTPRQRHAEQEARERERLHAAVAGFDDDATDTDEVPRG